MTSAPNPPGLRRVLGNIFCHPVAKRHPLRVGYRIARWQLWRRLTGRPMPFTGVTGARLLLVPGRSDSLSGFWYEDLPDFEELAFALHLAAPGEWVADVGANQGGWALTLASFGMRVMAFEPASDTRSWLLQNIQNNPQVVGGRVKVHGVALGEAEGAIQLSTGLDAGNHRLRGDGDLGKGETVPMVTADSVMHATQPVLIKIDVEGEELTVLRGAKAVLGHPELLAVIVETFRHDRYGQESLAAVERELASHGFKPFDYSPKTRAFSPLEGRPGGGQNTIYIRDLSRVEARLKSGRQVRVLGESF